MKHERIDLRILVRGTNDVASAVAHRLFQAGYAVVMHEDSNPTVTRRRMAFADAIFDGETTLDGVQARRVESLNLRGVLLSPAFIPVMVSDLSRLVKKLRPQVLVDARMQKHKKTARQFHLASLVIGLGPNFVAGFNVHLAVETARGDDLGRVITIGKTKDLEGEPISMEGYGRDRYVYAPVAGKFSTSHEIGDAVLKGQEIAAINSTPLYAPISGVIRGITHTEVPVSLRTKVIEIDPRGKRAQVSGIGERPAQIAEGVLSAIQNWETNHVH
ncbi:MAG: EF2563 family selenium-dependent molybdenum hydroxylase system protein [Chloroflexi bacterium]|nr:EF2563 family selenium-dependent molybdenum hydroxylase system protein [Chloroflexota bacterium]